MAQTDRDPLTTTVAANDKLLKALITLLSLKDDNLLEELTTVFDYASEAASDIGTAREATWRHVRQELAVIAALIHATGSSDTAAVLDS